MNDDSGPGPSPTPEVPTRTVEISDTILGGVIGPYRLVRQLGEGGMGVVYQAQQLRPIRRDVALKVIKPGMDSKQVIARFESERQALAIMDHPNIARVIDAGTTAAVLPYFVMELVDGIPITRYCDSKRMTIRERVELFIPVCQAIQHAHQKGVIHRDIKPSNILVTQREGKSEPKVIDFGLAKALGGHLTDATIMTNLGTVVGTLDYMSPEQAELGRQDVDTRSDVYSLGAVLYELLTGTTPLLELKGNASYIEVLQRIREEETKRPSLRLRNSEEREGTAELRGTDAARLPGLLDRELDWITMKALEKDRIRRYETVSGLARDLQRYLEGEPVEAAPLSAGYRMRKFIRKHRVWLATAAAFTAVLMAGVVVSAWMAIRARRAEAEAHAVNDFLRKDVLAQASANNQARGNTKPDLNLTVRMAVDRAAARIAGRLSKQPIVEASIRHTIGETYRDLGLYQDAELQLGRSLALRRQELGERNVDTLDTMDVLGDVYRDEGNYKQAEPLLIRAMDLGRDLLGEKDPVTLDIMDTLGTTYTQEGSYEKAEPLLTKVLALRRSVLGDEHPDTLISLQGLGILNYYQGRYGEAESLFRQLIQVSRRLFGDRYPDTIRAENNLAMDYEVQGKYAQAEPLLVSALKSSRDVLGSQHSDTVRAISNLALHYEHEGLYARAEPLFAEGLEGYRRVLGGEHPETLVVWVHLGSVRIQQRKYAEAESALRDAAQVYARAWPDAWQRYNCQSQLGASLAGQKRYAEAEPLLLAGYEGMLQRQATISAPSRSTLASAGQLIVQFYKDWGKPDKVAEWKQILQTSTSAIHAK